MVRDAHAAGALFLMDGAQAVLRRIPGDVPVYMYLAEEGITLLAPRESWCRNAAQARDALGSLLAPEDIKIVDKRERQAGT